MESEKKNEEEGPERKNEIERKN